MLNVGQELQICGRFVPMNGKKVPIMIEDHSGGVKEYSNVDYYEVRKDALEKMRERKPLSASFSEAQLNSAHENENFMCGKIIKRSDDNAKD